MTLLSKSAALQRFSKASTLMPTNSSPLMLSLRTAAAISEAPPAKIAVRLGELCELRARLVENVVRGRAGAHFYWRMRPSGGAGGVGATRRIVAIARTDQIT